MKLKTHHKLTAAFGLLVFALLAYVYFDLESRSYLVASEISSIQIRHYSGMIFAAVAVFMLIFNYVLSRVVTRPLERLTKVARSIAEGDFSKKASLAQGDEVDDLARAIDLLAEQMNQRIREAKTRDSRLEAVFLSMGEGIMAVDRDGHILLINEPLRKIFRIERDPVGRKPLEVVRNMDVQSLVDEVIFQRKPVEGREVSLFLPEERTLRIHAAPVLRDGKPDGAVLVFHDVTEFRRLETIRRDFVANVSHELRTPVASIKGYAETLLDGALEDQDHAKDFLRIIYSESDRLAELVDDLLMLARNEDGRPPLELKSCDARKMIELSLSGLASQIKQKEITIKLDIPENLPAVNADESAVAQIFKNLIENAVKYSKPDAPGQVMISAHAQGEAVQFCIADTGIGIPPEDLPRVFERFYRVDKSHNRGIDGTGLGLSIVKHIVQAHGGEIKAQSQLGQGTTFCFSLPIFRKS